nr:vegetative cell wall protein gp1-like [Arachis hypogaea]
MGKKVIAKRAPREKIHKLPGYPRPSTRSQDTTFTPSPSPPTSPPRTVPMARTKTTPRYPAPAKPTPPPKAMPSKPSSSKPSSSKGKRPAVEEPVPKTTKSKSRSVLVRSQKDMARKNAQESYQRVQEAKARSRARTGGTRAIVSHPPPPPPPQNVGTPSQPIVISSSALSRPLPSARLLSEPEKKKHPDKVVIDGAIVDPPAPVIVSELELKTRGRRIIESPPRSKDASSSSVVPPTSSSSPVVASLSDPGGALPDSGGGDPP